MITRNFAAVAIGFAALASPAHAQSGATGPSAPASGACELHFWPAGGAYSVVEGSAEFYAMPGVKREALEPIPAAHQIALAEALQPSALLGLDGYRLVPHAEGLPRLAVSGVATRHADSQSPCYAELIVSQIVFEDASVSGASIRELIVLRRFGAAPQVASSFSTWVMQPVQTTRLRHRLQRVSEEEIDGAFRANLVKFAGYALHPAAPKR